MANWGEILVEIAANAQHHNTIARSSTDNVRRKYLKELYDLTGRPVIAYYSGWLSKPGVIGTELNDDDKNGFMNAIHNLNKKDGLDLILHTPGGSVAVAESIVHYLKEIFGSDIRAIVPQISMSAGTMIACSCKQIIMGKHSNLGPVDPQIRGIPAAGVIEEFKKAFSEIKLDAKKVQVWQFVIRQYSPSYLGQCENAVKWARDFVEKELVANMLAHKKNKRALAKSIVKNLTDFSGTKAHDRHIHYDECKKLGLEVDLLENDPKLQDAVLSIHHAFMHALSNSGAFKIIENHLGVAFIKQQVMQAQQMVVPVQQNQPT
jgi:Serine dehydrogenase proteinase